ncbi:MAG: signal recognition particle-docking protein FtsY [Azospirillaceae bacterium]
MNDESQIESEADETGEPRRRGWFQRLREGLGRSSRKISDGISGIFTKRRLDDDALEELEELLIASDLGPATAARLTQALASTRFGKEVTDEEVKMALAAEVERILDPVARPLVIDGGARPFTVLVVGVNGTGKTTTIGKLAHQWTGEGRRVTIAAGDTFRAAAIEQLKVWGDRAGARVIARETGADAAGLAYDALAAARREGDDVLLIDTAGRLQNKENLMAELAKIVRVLQKQDAQAPHAILLVLDATTGQNARSQVEVFKSIVDITGLVVTKLDGSAKGGILVALAGEFALPVHAIGVGEGIDDLRPFAADQFARSLMGLGDLRGG